MTNFIEYCLFTQCFGKERCDIFTEAPYPAFVPD